MLDDDIVLTTESEPSLTSTADARSPRVAGAFDGQEVHPHALSAAVVKLSRPIPRQDLPPASRLTKNHISCEVDENLGYIISDTDSGNIGILELKGVVDPSDHRRLLRPLKPWLQEMDYDAVILDTRQLQRTLSFPIPSRFIPALSLDAEGTSMICADRP